MVALSGKIAATRSGDSKPRQDSAGELYYCRSLCLPLRPISLPMQLHRLRERLLAESVLTSNDLHVPPPASDTEILRCHDTTYLDRVVAGTLSAAEIRRIGFPWSPQMVERSRRSSGASIMAARTALRGDGFSANLRAGASPAATMVKAIVSSMMQPWLPARCKRKGLPGVLS